MDKSIINLSKQIANRCRIKLCVCIFTCHMSVVFVLMSFCTKNAWNKCKWWIDHIPPNMLWVLCVYIVQFVVKFKSVNKLLFITIYHHKYDKWDKYQVCKNQMDFFMNLIGMCKVFQWAALSKLPTPPEKELGIVFHRGNTNFKCIDPLGASIQYHYTLHCRFKQYVALWFVDFK